MAWINDVWRDIRFSLRTLRRNPGFTLTVLCVIALGTGANVAVFSLLNRVVLPPLPFPHPEDLVAIWEYNPDKGSQNHVVFPPSFLEWSGQTSSFAELAAYAYHPDIAFDIVVNSVPERIRGAAVSSGIFSLLGIRPLIGRGFLPEEDRPGGRPVAVLGYGLWQRDFNRNGGVIGSTIALNGRPYTIVGVLPNRLEFLEAADVWIPRPTRVHEAMSLNTIIYYSVAVLARLKPSVSVAEAQAELEVLERRMEGGSPNLKGVHIRVVPLKYELYGSIKNSLVVLLGAAGFVLLIGCVNVANLLLAHGLSRESEFAIRAAIGAKPWHLVRQVLTESVVLGVAGAALGLAFALWCSEALVSSISFSLPRLEDNRLDWHMVGFASSVALATGILFGLVPALRACRVHITDRLGGDSRSVVGSGRSRMFTALLVTGEIALTVMLLTGAGQLIEGFLKLNTAQLGFQPAGVLTAKVTLTGVTPHREFAILAEIEKNLKAIPGVTTSGISDALPYKHDYTIMGFQISGQENPMQELTTARSAVSPGFLETMGVQLIEGRVFTREDARDTTKVVIIDKLIADRFWETSSAIGHHLVIGRESWLIAGVVPHLRDVGVGRAPAQMQTYIPFEQSLSPFPVVNLVVRSALNPNTLVKSVQEAVRSASRDQPVAEIKSMADLVLGSLAERRFYLLLVCAFAGLALILASVGVYGVTSYSVANRTREVGIRRALGATDSHIVSSVLRQVAIPAAAGLFIGASGSFLLVHTLSALLFDIRSVDLPALVIVSALLLGVVLFSAYIPARGALRLDPVAALRE